MTEQQTPIMNEPQLQRLVCVNHPDRETLLRCNRCNNPICSSCAVRTPTGYRCKDCIRGQQRNFETSVNRDYIVAAVIAVIIAFAGSYTASVMQFFTIFVAPIIAMLIGEAVRWGVGRRRSRTLTLITTAATAVGAAPVVLLALFRIFTGLAAGFSLSLGVLGAILWPGVYLVLVTSTVYYRVSGIQV